MLRVARMRPWCQRRHGGRDGGGIAEAQAAQARQGIWIVVGAGEHQIAALAAERGFVLEERGIMRLDRAQMGQQRIGESGLVGEAHGTGERGTAVHGVRNPAVRLVIDQLQAVLEPAEEAVRFDQLVRCPPVRAAGGGERAQRIAGRARAQRCVAPTPNELLSLRVQLDLANAAAAELDVVAGDLDGAEAGLGVDLPFDRLDVLNGRKIEILAPDEGPQPLHQLGAYGEIARHRARLDHHGALPVLPVALVILLGRQRRERERRRTRVGPEPELRAIHTALVGAFGEQGGEIANEAVQGFRDFAPPPVAHALRVEQHDQGEFARIGELACTEPAHAEHGQPARCSRRVALCKREGAACSRLPQQMIQCAGEHGFRNAGESRSHRLKRPGAGKVGERGGERCPVLCRPQPPGDAATVAAAGGEPRYLVEHALERRVGAAFGHQAKLGRFAGQHAAERGGVAEHAVEEVAGVPVAREGGGEGLIGATACRRRRAPSLPTRARAVARVRLGIHRIVRQKGQERHRAPIVLQRLA